MNIQQFWFDVLAQRADKIREYFHTDAYVNWHCSGEHFTVEEFIRANCEYPGDWDGEVEKIVTTDDMIITATRVYPKDRSASFHVTSFIKLKDDKIAAMVEESAHYYAKVGNQSIVRYEKHGDVSITEFANGVIVYVNYADEAVTYGSVTLEANSFIYR